MNALKRLSARFCGEMTSVGTGLRIAFGIAISQSPVQFLTRRYFEAVLKIEVYGIAPLLKPRFSAKGPIVINLQR